MFAVDMGTGQGYVSIKDLRRTFFIETGSHDDRLIDRVEAGLRYVPDIRPGDEIPTEILDGTASWTVARKHKQIARDRLQVQLLSWMSGKPISYATQEDLKKIIADDANKKALKDAFNKAAVALGIDPNESEKVLDRIETLAREICYIEALRDRAREVLRVRANVEVLIKVYSGDQRMSADLGRIKILMVKAVAETDDVFNNIDAETADVLSALMATSASKMWPVTVIAPVCSNVSPRVIANHRTRVGTRTRVKSPDTTKIAVRVYTMALQPSPVAGIAVTTPTRICVAYRTRMVLWPSGM